MNNDSFAVILTHWIIFNPIPFSICVILITLAALAVIAFIQGKEVSLWPPRIGGKPIRMVIGGSDGGQIGVFDAVRIRKSVRSYQKKPVGDAEVEKLLDAARLAPSASNRQEWRFVVVRDRETLMKVAKASCIHSFIRNPPAVIVACAETDSHRMKGGEMSYPIDLAIALDHISLCAVSMGLGSCWIGLYDEPEVRAILGIPDPVKIVSLMVIGYPEDPTPVEKKRLPLGRIMKFEKW